VAGTREQAREDAREDAGDTAADEADAFAPWVIDADGHVVEPVEMWSTHLPGRFRSYAPWVLQLEDHFRFVCNDRIGFRIGGRNESLGAPGQTPHQEAAPVAALGGSDPRARLDDMAVDQIGTAALYPTWGLMIQGVSERGPALALCRAVNDWLAGYCAVDPVHLIGVGTLPMTDAADALDEARRCVEQLGFRAVWRRPEQPAGAPRPDDAAYEPLWSFLEEADAALAVHPGLSGVIPVDELRKRYDDDFASMHAVHFVTEQIMAITSYIGGGVLERHPRLRVAFLETGAVWALSYLHRLDEHVETFGFDRAGLSMKPSEYFRRQCFVSVEGMEPALGAMVEAFPESVVFASDYPHGDAVFPGSTGELLATTELGAPRVRAILRDNGRRLYALDEQ
jgi:predicted TIM-barrel fold metal-dependent hydrolase